VRAFEFYTYSTIPQQIIKVRARSETNCETKNNP